MVYGMTNVVWMPSYFLCGKRLNLHYDLAGHSIEPLKDYPFTREDLDHNKQGQTIGSLGLLFLLVRPTLWFLFYRTVKKLRGLVPTDSKTSNIVAMTRTIVRVGWVPFVLEMAGLFCAVAAFIAQQFLDQDEDQIVNCIFCFQLWMVLSAKRLCFVRSICGHGLQGAFDGLARCGAIRQPV